MKDAKQDLDHFLLMLVKMLELDDAMVQLVFGSCRACHAFEELLLASLELKTKIENKIVVHKNVIIHGKFLSCNQENIIAKKLSYLMPVKRSDYNG